MRLLVLVGVSFVLVWLVFVLILTVALPRGMGFRAAKSFVPDFVRLLRNLAGDSEASRGVRIRLGVLLVYLGSPIDLIPDFVPILGVADDVIVVSLVLRAVVRHAGVDVLRRHWSGSDEGFDLVKRLAGVGHSELRDSIRPASADARWQLRNGAAAAGLLAGPAALCSSHDRSVNRRTDGMSLSVGRDAVTERA